MATKVVAEISANHGGQLDRARKLVQAAADAGASMVKLQTYTADTITVDVDLPAFRVSEDHPLWAGRTLHSLYDEAHTPWEWHEELFNLARSLGIQPFSSPFDLSAVDFLESLDCPVYKIASLEIGDIPLIESVAATGKPVIVSTGAASLTELDDAVAAARKAGCEDLTLLVCTSSYPAQPKDAHVRRMDFLRSTYGTEVGLSDHTLGLGVSIAAVALGATVIERHVILNRSEGGPDADFSLEPAELAQLVEEVGNAGAALGEQNWIELGAESESRRFKRSLFVTKDAASGERITPENIRSIRPAGGLEPKHLSVVLGRTFSRSVRRGEPLSWDLVAGD